MRFIKHKLFLVPTRCVGTDGRAASCTVTLARHKPHSHAARGNEENLT